MLMSVNILCGKYDVWSYLNSLGMKICLIANSRLSSYWLLHMQFLNFSESFKSISANLFMSVCQIVLVVFCYRQLP